MKDIKGLEAFTKIEPLKKGLSGDEKHYIETSDSRCLSRPPASNPQGSSSTTE